MRCRCGDDDPDPTITGLYTLPSPPGEPEKPYGAGYTCRKCKTDCIIPWLEASQPQRRAADLADQAREAMTA